MNTTEIAAFSAFAKKNRVAVEAHLAAVLSEAEARARRAGLHAEQVVAAFGKLSTRGGKRLRAVLVAAAYEACGGEDTERVVPACVAVELLHAYLLVHDDWMDQDAVRRGGPSVHVALRETLGDERRGDVAAILAGDYGSGLAQSVLLTSRVPAERLVEAARLFARIQEDVVTGQVLDVFDLSGPVDVKHDLKTGSYTVRGPLAIGAALAGATPEQRSALDRFATPLGVAFQLRDDLLGTFGDTKTTGKPAASDLREGKRTALVEEGERDPVAGRLLERVLGVADASDVEVNALVSRLAECGAKGRVESRIDALAARARAELQGAPFAATARAVLEGAALALASRES